MKKFDGLSTPLTTLLLIVVIGGFGVGCRDLPDSGAPRGEKVYNNCQSCHGADGLGRPELQAPAIAGLSPWYVENQLKKFREGHRGRHAEDYEGLRMRPLSKTIRDDADLKAVAEYVSSMTPQKPPKTVMDGDPGRGADYFKTCVACHGADGAGMQALNAPSLRYSQDWYLLRQLEKFEKGIRGRAQGDVTGAQMAAMINAVPDEQAKKDVVAYIQKLK